MIHIALIEPEIPQNTGNIARSCVVTGSELILVHPLGFKTDEKSLRRAGIDYWKEVNLVEFSTKEEFFESLKGKEFYLFSAKGALTFSDIDYKEKDDITLIFGKESVGLDDEIINKYYDRVLRIPLIKGKRCLNLSNAVAVALYEVERQWNYRGLEKRR